MSWAAWECRPAPLPDSSLSSFPQSWASRPSSAFHMGMCWEVGRGWGDLNKP